MRKLIVTLMVACVVVAGCTAGDDQDATDDTGGSSEPTASTAAPTGPAPGVTDDTIRVGVTYVDLEAIADVVDIGHGDYEASFQALIDRINADGGIHGRQLESVVVPIDPVGTDSAEAACVQLTEDDPVFIAVGFFLDDAVLCPVATHETAVVGGVITPERQQQATAPWFSNEPSTEFQNDVVRAMAEAGELDGSLGVFSSTGEADQMEEVVLPLLEELGVEVTESAVLDAPDGDVAAANAATAVIAERFESAGVDQVLTIGNSGLAWANGTETLDYRPQLFLTNPDSVLAWAGDEAGHDLSVLDGAVAGNLYGDVHDRFDEEGMAECIQTIRDAGVVVEDPPQGPSPSSVTYVAPMNTCKQMAILGALLEAAGEDLNYGSLAAGAEGLEVQVPGEPDLRTFGSPPDNDGNPTVYLFEFAPDVRDFVPIDG